MEKIYLLEDDAGIRELVVYTLNASGYDAHGFEESKEFLAAVEQDIPALVLLDIMLPGEDGLSVLRKLRASSITQCLPVIMLTAKSTEYDKVLGLDMGADDYIAKPFGMLEMVSRVKALLRRTEAAQSTEPEKDEMQIGLLRMDQQKHRVYVQKERVELTLKEYDLLSLLMQHPGQVYTREQILQQVWGYAYEGETRTVDVHVRTLRQKLGEAGKAVETVRGVGYRLGEEA